MTRIPKQCFCCIHYHRAEGLSCDAYPEFAGIPQELLFDQFDHRQPYPNDRGIRWEPYKPGQAHPADKKGERVGGFLYDD